MLPKGLSKAEGPPKTDSEALLNYLYRVLGDDTEINVFVNSHRDADHMRGIDIVHQYHPIREIWDSGVPGTTTDTSEYETYMRLRRQIGYKK